MNVLITGTSSGIGNALAIEFLEHGATVYGISRRLNENLNAFQDYYHLSHDLLKLNEMPGKINNFLGHLKTLDLVILNAGILSNINDIKKTPVDDIMVMMQVNVWANKVIIDTLLEKVGCIHQIVAISCGSDLNNARGLNAYSLSKMALNTMIKFYSKVIPQTHFSALAPGLIDSDLQKHISELADGSNYPVIKKLKAMRENGQLTNPYFAANYLVEAMGTVLQEESGSYKDIKDVLYLEPDKTGQFACMPSVRA
jgi:benzil reductase ((S)-benzoin forming)